MPRQPYLPTFSNVAFAVGALATKDRPDLCAAIGRCIAIWGQVDNEMGNLFGLLLKADSDGAIEVFLTLRRTSHQLEAIRAAAPHTLSGDNLQTCLAIVKVYASLEKERNALAHGCFGVSADDPSILFWVDIKDHVHFQTEVLAAELRGEPITNPHARLKEKLFVYRLNDLYDIYEQMERFWYNVFYFNGFLRRSSDAGMIERHKQIRLDPRIQAAFEG